MYMYVYYLFKPIQHHPGSGKATLDFIVCFVNLDFFNC